VIVSPRRSVTRFFIPLIDVLILLFCIFLLMPFVSGPALSETTPDAKTPDEKPLPTDVKKLQEMLKEEQMRVARLEREKQARLADRLVVKLLEIDPTNGTLFYYGPERQDIKTQADAVRFITREKARASEGGVVKDVYFLILYPRKITGYPKDEQIQQMKEWFKDVPHGFDSP
jgi:hypothetical protein